MFSKFWTWPEPTILEILFWGWEWCPGTRKLGHSHGARTARRCCVFFSRPQGDWRWQAPPFPLPPPFPSDLTDVRPFVCPHCHWGLYPRTDRSLECCLGGFPNRFHLRPSRGFFEIQRPPPRRRGDGGELRSQQYKKSVVGFACPQLFPASGLILPLPNLWDGYFSLHFPHRKSIGSQTNNFERNTRESKGNQQRQWSKGGHKVWVWQFAWLISNTAYRNSAFYFAAAHPRKQKSQTKYSHLAFLKNPK